MKEKARHKQARRRDAYTHTRGETHTHRRGETHKHTPADALNAAAEMYRQAEGRKKKPTTNKKLTQRAGIADDRPNRTRKIARITIGAIRGAFARLVLPGWTVHTIAQAQRVAVFAHSTA